MEPLYLAIGLAAGVLSGLFGVGGGILIVPALIFFAKFPTKLALGTSLGALLLPVGLLGVLTYYKSGHFEIRASLFIALGLFFGAWGGARLAQVVPAATLQRMFALFIALMAVRLWIEAGRNG
ncbi:MAG: sulfite exporter TauE/SafE family protein [Gemmatimonadales bacterium]